MKNKLIILFTVGFMLMIPTVKAESFNFQWLPNQWTYDHTNADVIQEYSGKKFVPKHANNQQTEILKLYAPSFNVPKGSSRLLLTGLLQFQKAYDIVIECSHESSLGSSITCTKYGSLSEFGVSIQAKAFYNNGNLGSFCDIKMVDKTGFFKLECPVFSNASTVDQVSFHIYHTSYSPTIQPEMFIGLSRDIMFYESGDNSINAAIKDQTNQQHQDSQAQLEEQKKQTEALTNSNVDVNGDFFNGFDNNTHGLTSVITAPLQLIGSITSSTCSPLTLPMPFGMPNAQLPCMGTIYKNYFGTFFTLYQTITHGFISYWVCVNLFAMVKGFKDPDSDKVEVLDL